MVIDKLLTFRLEVNNTSREYMILNTESNQINTRLHKILYTPLDADICFTLIEAKCSIP